MIYIDIGYDRYMYYFVDACVNVNNSVWSFFVVVEINTNNKETDFE